MLDSESYALQREQEIISVARDYSKFPDERVALLKALDVGDTWWNQWLRGEHVGVLQERADRIETLVGRGPYKFIVTVTAKKNTSPYVFSEKLALFVERFNYRLLGRYWKRHGRFVRGFVAIESLARDLKTRVNIHAHIVFYVPPELGRKLVGDIRAAAKYAVRYPRSGLNVFNKRRVHACTIRRKSGESKQMAQRRVAKYFTKTLSAEGNPDLSYGPGLYILDKLGDAPYGLHRIA